MSEVKKKTSSSTKTTAKKTTTKKPAAKKNTTKTASTKPKQTVAKTPEKKEPVKTPTIIQEENHFGRTILAAALILVIFVGGYLGIKYKMDSGDSEARYTATEDEARFKSEYENLNGTTRSNGQKNKDVSIKKHNNIKYIDTAEAAKILDSGTGVIYFGFAACPWCRTLAPTLIDAMSASELDTIYYVDVRPEDKAENDIRDRYELDSRNKAKKAKDADSSYYDILLALAGELKEYTLTTQDGKTVHTGEKRLFAPTVVAVKDGVVVDIHEGTVENHEKDENGTLRDLTKEEETTLFNELSSLISKYLDSGCNEDGC